LPDAGQKDFYAEKLVKNVDYVFHVDAIMLLFRSLGNSWKFRRMQQNKGRKPEVYSKSCFVHRPS